LDQLPGVEQELARVTEEGVAVAPRLDELKKSVADLPQAAAAYRALEVRLGEAEKRSQTAIRAHTEAEGRRASLKQRLTELDQLLAGAEAITTRWKELEVARVAEQAMTRQQEAAQRHEMAFQKAGERIAVELARLEAALSTAQGLLAEAESAITRLPGLRAECKRLAKEREALGELDREKEDLRGRESALRQAAATAVVQAEHAKLVNVDVKAKEAQLTGASTCPVCQGPLTAAEAARLLGEYKAQRDGLRETHEHARAEAAAGLKEAHALAARPRLIETDWKRREGALRAAEGEAEARLQRAEEVEQKLPALRREVAAGADVITREAFGEAERAKQTAAREALKACGYDASGHTTLRERIGVLAGADEEYRSLAQAQTAATGILDQLTELEGAIDALRTAGAESAREESEAREALESATDAGPRLHQAEEELSGFRNLQGELLRKQGKLEQRREHLVAQEARLERTRDELKALREEEHTYGDLAAAFGKNGVQAMLIERSLPRVQQMVNETLDRMTGGRIHVGLSTQRFSASGKVTETLDIRISDDVGTRDYAMYSGGEAFRVDFALRIALARLLAERSGASLPTLIIDEGFGTQDAEGLDRLVEAITAIQEDFRLILVVTHIEELRERFGRRIEVTKDAQRGSFARVV
ncbi:MAG: SbcC/MukB-like Walker B domain-containing protein, partial [Tepidiformaceae bacterium]